ncbi:MAG: hypothetical protein E7652_09010 [Ruminococcaceae bacterium]|nr:hypothetical protein [Oscillospiraceae bacterium]
MKKLSVLFALIMVFAVMATLAVPVFADTEAAVVEHDHDGDGVADHAADAHEDEGATWEKLGVSGYIAVAVAAVIAVAAVTAIVLLAPKKSKHK